MNKSKLAIIIDTFFISLTLLIISFVWMNKLVKNAILSLFISIIVSIIAFYVIFLYYSKKYLSNKISKLAEKKLNNTINFLTFCSEKEYIDLLKNHLQINHITGYIFETNSTYLYINTKTSLCANDFHSANNFILNQTISKPLIFISTKTTPEFDILLKNSPVKYDYFPFLELFQLMNINEIYNKKPDNPIKIFLKKAKESFSKHNFKNYLMSGLSLIILSVFIPFSLYYLIFGTLLIIFSFICLFSKQPSIVKNSKKSLSEIIKS